MVLVCSSAWAAGPATDTYNWTGFYGGLNAGLVANDSSYTAGPAGLLAKELPPEELPFVTHSGNLNNCSATFGGQVGYNYQCGCFVYGLETDFNYNGSSTSVTGPTFLFPGGTYTGNQQIDYFGTLRARLGYTPANRLLLYVTGGLAYGDVSSSTTSYTPVGLFYGSSSGMQAGWTAGFGTEYAITNCWSIKLEYLYIDLGSTSYTSGFPDIPGVGAVYSTNVDTAQHIMRVGFNFKF
ncbi:MAG: outer membrane protein [Syntrophobacteraceae bacterium]